MAIAKIQKSLHCAFDLIKPLVLPLRLTLRKSCSRFNLNLLMSIESKSKRQDISRVLFLRPYLDKYLDLSLKTYI